jgi:hypothetical protein
LERLTQACDPVSFGLEKREILDETYREGGKMDPERFASPLHPPETDLIKIIRSYLLEGTRSSKYIVTELQKLNVYSKYSIFVLVPRLSHCPGKGSSFKRHIDPPRSQYMFGSLVIVFPTPHEGGALLLRHRGKEWVFESGQGLTTAHEPFISYIAFFGDVEHEVAQVISGHRVTLTFNLYFDDGVGTISSGGATSEHVSLPPAVNENEFRTAFQALLENPEFLEDGGTLAFGMRHVYPILDGSKHASPLEPLYGALKGSDAVVYQTARGLGFQPVLCMCYQIDYPVYSSSGDPGTTAGGTVVDFSSSGWLKDENVDIVSKMLEHDGIAVHQEGWWSQYVDFQQVEWVTPVMTLNRKTSPFVSGGKGSGLGLGYADLCMFVSIGAAGKRLVYPSLSELKEE